MEEVWECKTSPFHTVDLPKGPSPLDTCSSIRRRQSDSKAGGIGSDAAVCCSHSGWRIGERPLRAICPFVGEDACAETRNGKIGSIHSSSRRRLDSANIVPEVGCEIVKRSEEKT